MGANAIASVAPRMTSIQPASTNLSFFLSMTEEYLRGKGKRIAPTYLAAITKLSRV
jgi:hypothetical protein